MITTTYDLEADALYVRLARKGAPVAETREVEDGVLLDLDDAGRVVGIEVLSVSRRASSPAAEAAPSGGGIGDRRTAA